MRVNSSTKIISSKIILIPYRISHVEKYHKWMESEELRKQTASERLRLSEEYEMQQTWLRDDNKCTFIVLDKNTDALGGSEVDAMIGDANLYLTKDEDDLVAEVGLMIAEPKFRGKGFGKEALLCLLNYGIKVLNITRFTAVISWDNSRCIKMFQNFKFEKINESKIFNEVTLGTDVNADFINFVINTLETYIETTTEENV